MLKSFHILCNFIKYIDSENPTSTKFLFPNISHLKQEDLTTFMQLSLSDQTVFTLKFRNNLSNEAITGENILYMLENEPIYVQDNFGHISAQILFNKKNYFHPDFFDTPNFFVFFDVNNAIEKIYSHPEILSIKQKTKLLILDNKNLINLENRFLVIKSIAEIDFNEFSQTDYDVDEKDSKKLNSQIDFFKEKNCKQPQQTPYFWGVNQKSNEVCENFRKKFYLNALKSFFSLIADKKISETEFLIRGHYNLEFILDENIQDLNYNNLFNLLDFISDDSSEDKILILRNVLTNYLTKNSNSDSFCSQLEGINSSVRHHYSLFIQEELKVFLEQKQQVITEATNLARTVSEHTSTVTSNLKTNIFSFVLALITGSIPDLVEKVDNNFILITIAFLMFGYLIINIFNLYDQETLVDSSIDSFRNSLKYIASNSIDGLKFEELKKNFFKEEYRIFVNTSITALITYLILIGINITIIVILIIK